MKKKQQKTMALHVRIESLYISLPSSAKQQREMGDARYTKSIDAHVEA